MSKRDTSLSELSAVGDMDQHTGRGKQCCDRGWLHAMGIWDTHQHSPAGVQRAFPDPVRSILRAEGYFSSGKMDGEDEEAKFTIDDKKVGDEAAEVKQKPDFT